MKDNTVELFSGKKLSDIEEKQEQERKEILEKNLQLFDEVMAVYRAAMEEGTLTLGLTALVDGVVVDQPYVTMGDGGCFAKLSILLTNLSEQMSDLSLGDMIPFSEEDLD